MKKRGQYHSKRDQVTTGEAAKMLGVSMRTISNWMDKGSLPFWRVNKDRRMFVVDLLKFAEQNKMPVRHIENKIVGEETPSDTSVSVHETEIKMLHEKIFFLEAKVMTMKTMLDHAEEILTSGRVLLSDPKFVKVEDDARKAFMEKLTRFKILA